MALAPTLPVLKAAIQTEIKAAMNPGDPSQVTTVHTFRRFWRDDLKFRNLFKRPTLDLNPGIINGWMIFRPRTREIEAEERFRFYSLHRIEMHGYVGVQDSGFTEQDFEDQIEVIRDRLRLNTTVFGNTERVTPVTQVDSVQAVLIGNATAWFAQLSLETEAIEVKTLP